MGWEVEGVGLLQNQRYIIFTAKKINRISRQTWAHNSPPVDFALDYTMLHIRMLKILMPFWESIFHSYPTPSDVLGETLSRKQKAQRQLWFEDLCQLYPSERYIDGCGNKTSSLKACTKDLQTQAPLRVGWLWREHGSCLSCYMSRATADVVPRGKLEELCSLPVSYASLGDVLSREKQEPAHSLMSLLYLEEAPMVLRLD